MPLNTIYRMISPKDIAPAWPFPVNSGLILPMDCLTSLCEDFTGISNLRFKTSKFKFESDGYYPVNLFFFPISVNNNSMLPVIEEINLEAIFLLFYCYPTCDPIKMLLTFQRYPESYYLLSLLLLYPVPRRFVSCLEYCTNLTSRLFLSTFSSF